VKGGTGLAGQPSLFCPYCRFEGAPAAFTTEEQVRYAKEFVAREFHSEVGRLLKRAVGTDASGKRTIGGGLFSIEMSVTSSPPPTVRRPLEEELRRDVVCPQCGLDQSVYGMATWCSDCGNDIFLTHVEGEHAVIRSMLADIPRRRDTLGARVGGKDLENCLEDCVSVFEAVLKLLFARHLKNAGLSGASCMEKIGKIRNAFQNPERAEEIFREETKIPILSDLNAEERGVIIDGFQKRHPISHNLGIVDRKYLRTVQSVEREGKEVRVTSDDVHELLVLCRRVFETIYRSLPSIASTESQSE